MGRLPGDASVMLDVCRMLLPPDPRVAPAMFVRAALARRWRRRHTSLRVRLRKTLVHVLGIAKLSVQPWMRAPARMRVPAVSDFARRAFRKLRRPGRREV